MSKNLNVLLVEDDTISQKIGKVIMRLLNNKVDIINTGEGAIDLVKQKHYDLIFMDVGLPDMNGLETSKQIRTMHNGKDCKIFALTAHLDKKDVKEDRFGLNGILIKPLTTTTCANIISKYFKQSDTTKED